MTIQDSWKKVFLFGSFQLFATQDAKMEIAPNQINALATQDTMELFVRMVC